MASARFVPPHPPRGAGPVPVWRGFFGERARNSVFGWSQQAFRIPHMKRRILGYNVHIPLTPDSVQQVLQTNAANYVKPDVVKRLLSPVIGRGLLTADGQLWRDQRRIVAANFAPAPVDALIPIFGKAAADTAAGWEPGTVEDLAEAATATTMTIIADTLFGADPRLKTREALSHIAAALKASIEARLTAMLGLPTIPYSRTIRAGQRGQEFLRRTLADVVRERLPDGGPDDFLGNLIRGLRAQYEPAEALNLAVDNAATFYLAGHETTANAITWTLYLLSEQPDWQEQVAVEAKAAISTLVLLRKQEPSPSQEHIMDRLPILRRVIEEALRLYPPVPRLDRQAAAADSLNGYDILPGDIISIWPWLLGRHQSLWDDPDAFDPDRWLPERRAAYHRFQYIPFGAGPRICVGMRFATVEALTVLAHWLAEWRISPLPGHEVRPVGTVTLRPEGGLPLRLERR
jgi:cytochrome P450